MSDTLILEEFKNNGARKILLSEIYVRYGHLIMGTSMKYLKNKQDAEDITMIFFEKLPAKLINHEIQHLKSWMYMVIKNDCLMKLRKKKYTTTEHKIEPEAKEGIELVIEKEEQYQLLEAAIEELKDEQKKCITLFYMEKQSYQEISSKLSMDIKKVKSAIQNGKRNLKIKLERTNEEY